jgi:Protein of unknown function (DUF1592)/Protein of unknown function (DUF1588)/Protein of unknown function (DUF1587)/Protein of unknown function (DUF1585)/Protein of unknown function (DUF1595)
MARGSDLMRATLPVLLVVCAAPGAHPGAPVTPSTFETVVKPFLTMNCYLCHNDRLKNADVNLQAYETPASIVADPATWEKAIVKMRTGQMPPPPMSRPRDADVARITAWIEGELERADRAAPPDPGRVTARRLNRTEYDNTVRDLLGVTLRPADDFPQDDSGYGFDNVADVLSLSPVLMEKYMAAADRVARAALFGLGDLPPTLVRLQPAGAKIEPRLTALTDYDVTGLSLPNALHVVHRFPVEAEYLFRVVLSGARPAGSEPLQVGLSVDGGPLEILALDPEGAASFFEDRQDFSGKTREFRARVTAGEHWIAASIVRLYEGLPASFGGPNPSKRPAPSPRPLKPGEEPVPANGPRVRHLEIVGPFDPVPGPTRASLEKVYVCGHLHGGHRPGCLSRIVADLARRAYRRPVLPSEVAPLVRLASTARQQGDSFEEALGAAIQAILVSPDFLFRIEQDPRTAGAARPISEHELASRLSYFIWASMPDEELRRCADQGTLRQPRVLATQLRRMLKDEKAGALVEAFGGQWLQFRALESVSPDRERFPDFDNALRLAMRKETELFLRELVREDRSILDLLDARYTFLNERLARHYGIAGVHGPEFRRVDLPVAGRRSGVLTQGSVLTVSSYATRTSPVLRGKWILENVLAAPPPDPPAGTPRLDEAKIAESGSLRHQMEAHRRNATCAACHSKMDPLGFGLENYDGIGAWRTADGKYPIDASGALPDGRTFHGPEEMKAILKQDRAAFALCLTEKMLTYALGRGLERPDKRVVREIAQRLAGRQYRFSALVEEIVKSLPFQMRRKDRTKA